MPSPKNGIGPGESLTIRFHRWNGEFADLTQALNDKSQFRIVEHVQGLYKGGSVWAVSGQTEPVPLPGTLTLVAGALAIVAVRPRLFRDLR